MKRVAVFLVLATVVMALVACGAPNDTAPGQEETPPAAPPPQSSGASLQSAQAGGQELPVQLQDPGGSGEYAFDPAQFNFSVGDTVTFVLTSETEFHTFTVDELGINAEVPASATDSVTYTFEQAGEFQLICIPHEALGMVGTITVE